MLPLRAKAESRETRKEPHSQSVPRYYEKVDPTCIISDSDSEEEFGEDLAEPIEPNSFYKKSPKVEVPEATESCLRKYFQSKLEATARRSMAREDPLPDIPSSAARKQMMSIQKNADGGAGVRYQLVGES